jgi:hypothetical protein
MVSTCHSNESLVDACIRVLSGHPVLLLTSSRLRVKTHWRVRVTFLRCVRRENSRRDRMYRVRHGGKTPGGDTFHANACAFPCTHLAQPDETASRQLAQMCMSSDSCACVLDCLGSHFIGVCAGCASCAYLLFNVSTFWPCKGVCARVVQEKNRSIGCCTCTKEEPATAEEGVVRL